jgi:hypothetical protein
MTPIDGGRVRLREKSMEIINYRTNEVVRTATQAEAESYMARLAGLSPEGVVDGSAYGLDFPIYMA